MYYFFIGFFAPQGRSEGMLITTFLLLHWIFCPAGPFGEMLITNLLLFHCIFCPAGPLGRNFNDKCTTFSLDFFDPQGCSAGILVKNLLFFWIFCPAGPLGRNLDNKISYFFIEFFASQGRSFFLDFLQIQKCAQWHIFNFSGNQL